MTELITIEQANTIMLALIVILPILGAAIGAVNKQTITGLKWGIGVGLLNFVLWKLYNSITDSLGLDTVRNLLVNLGLFIAIGIVGGIVTLMIGQRGKSNGSGGSNPINGGGELASVGAGPTLRGPGAAKSLDEVDDPPRDAG